MQNSGRTMKFVVFSLTTNELLSLKPEERDFLLTSSFIMNDIRFYWSLMSRSPIDANSEYLRSMQTVRWLWSSRKLASVIYEADLALGAFIARLPVAKLASDVSPRISKVNNKSPFKKLAETIRNKAAYHYDTEVLAAKLSEFSPDQNHRLFAHDQRGNSISELGEQIYTLQLLLNADKSSSAEGFNNWLEACSGSILNFCERVTAKVLDSAFPDKTYQYESLSTKNEAENQHHRWPLFLVVPALEATN